MDVARAGEGSYRKGAAEVFTGEVWLRTTLSAESDGTNIGLVHFSPGARTNWHTHAGGQFLFVVSGRGRVRSRGEAGHVLEPGDVIHVEAGEWHFHGGTPESPVVHVAVNVGGDAQMGEPVTDEEYAEGF
jgi:quercetin dioxygenase-like cupin family protein